MPLALVQSVIDERIGDNHDDRWNPHQEQEHSQPIDENDILAVLCRVTAIDLQEI